MLRHKEKAIQLILDLPFYIMIFFAPVHLGSLVQLNIAGHSFDLGFLNQIASLLYLALLYLWALFVNSKRWIQVTALGMGGLSVICIAVSLANFGNSINDTLCAGSAVLSLLYVFENAQYLLNLTKNTTKLISFGIWFFVAFSIVLFIFFPSRQTQWGEGTYFFGHKFASSCGLMTILIALKLLNQPKAVSYWILLLISYVVCFWTGARVYVLSGLGTMYAVLYVFSKGIKEFLMKCVAVTLVAITLFFTSSTVTKNANIAVDTAQKLETETYQDMDKRYVWANAMTNGRPTMWKNCWDSYIDLSLINKLVGSGNKYIYEHNNSLNSHTDYLNILHYHGIAGLTFYLAIFICYAAQYWKKNELSVILLIGFWGIWFVLAAMNGYMSYTANMMSVPYLSVMAIWNRNGKTM